VQRGFCSGTSYCCTHRSTSSSTSSTGGGAAATGVEGLLQIVDTASSCSSHSYAHRGRAPRAFLHGMAHTFAKAVCNPSRADVVFVGDSAIKGTSDVLGWYASILLSQLGATAAGLTTVRQLYTLLLGLGMMESSGRWCVGRDMSASFSSANTAEAGLFQTSWGGHTRTSVLTDLFNQYHANPNAVGCAASIYKQHITCSAGDMRNWGTADQQGYQWQALTKDCPAFATEYAAVLLRVNGGQRGEWGPLRRKTAEVVPACYAMFEQVQKYVDANRASLCSLLA